jgi:hypothetical protein
VADFSSGLSSELDIPLGELTADAGTKRMVERILGNTEESARPPVMPFNSGI